MDTLERADIRELHYIASFDNVSSLLEHGIWCHNKVKHLQHSDASNQAVQERREGKEIPRAVAGRRALTIHDHANLYFNAHNAMMHNFLMEGITKTVCVLRVSPQVLDYRHTVLSNRNASTYAAEFQSARGYFSNDSREIDILKAPILQAGSLGPRKGLSWENYKQMRQAEVLVPYRIPPKCIQGIYVTSNEAKAELIDRIGQVFPHEAILVCSTLIPTGGEELPFSDHLAAYVQNQHPLPPLSSPIPSPPVSPPPSPGLDNDMNDS